MADDSNFAKFISLFNAASVEDKNALEMFGIALGAAADISGAGELVSIVVDKVESILNSSSDGNAAVERYLSAIQAEAGLLIASERIAHLITRLQDLKKTIGVAQGDCEGLPGELQSDPPPSQDFKFGQINECRGIVDGLNNDEQFATNVLEEKYYEDPWSGPIAPQDGDFVLPGAAHSTKFILAQFLRALDYFLTVGQAFDQNFVRDNREHVLQPYLDRLESTYGKVVQNIVALRAPSQDELLGPPHFIGIGDEQAYEEFGGFCNGPWAKAGNPIPQFDPNPVFYQMYGAVDRFAAHFAVGNYPGVPVNADFTINGPAGTLDFGSPVADFIFPAPNEFYTRFVAGHSVQNLYAWKQVYLGIGLDKLKTSIDEVRKILGQAPSDGFALPSGLWWSLRETHDALGDVFPEAAPPAGQTTAVETIDRLGRLGGLSSRGLSWRTSLNAVLMPIELRGVPNVQL